jgi:hypothetical protein
MRLVDGKHVIQQFAAAAGDPALGDAVLTADRGPHSRDIYRIAAGTSLPYLASWSRIRNLVAGS